MRKQCYICEIEDELDQWDHCLDCAKGFCDHCGQGITYDKYADNWTCPDCDQKPSHDRKDYAGQATVAALIRVEHAKAAIDALQYVMRYLGSPYERQTNDEYDRIHRLLYEKVTREYQAVAMFGLIAGDKYLHRARKAVFEHYLKDKAAMGYLDLHSTWAPGYFSTEEEETFKREIEAAVTCEADHDHSMCSAPQEAQKLHDTLQELTAVKEKYEAMITEFASFDRNRKDSK